MDPIEPDDLAATVGTDAERHTLLREIMGKVAGLDPAAADEELDRWWGSVEADRLASGLTLATITRLASPGPDEPAGPWLLLSDEAGHGATRLAPAGREALRQCGPAAGVS